MGIRPNMSLVCALTDVECDSNYHIIDPRYNPSDPEAIWFDEFPVWKIPYKNIDFDKIHPRQFHVQSAAILYTQILAGKKIGDYIVHNPEYGLGNVYGLATHNPSDLYDHDVLWALSAIDEKHSVPGYEFIPEIPLETDMRLHSTLLRKLLQKEIDPKDDFVQRNKHGIALHRFVMNCGWNIGHSVVLCPETRAEITFFVLKYLGWTGIKRSDLKFILYWDLG